MSAKAGGSINEGIIRGWIIGVGFDDETETHMEYEITDREPPGLPEANWLRCTIIVDEWREE